MVTLDIFDYLKIANWKNVLSLILGDTKPPKKHQMLYKWMSIKTIEQFFWLQFIINEEIVEITILIIDLGECEEVTAF